MFLIVELCYSITLFQTTAFVSLFGFCFGMKASIPQKKTNSPSEHHKNVVFVGFLWLCLFLYGLYVVGMLQHGLRLLGYPFAVDYVEWPEISRAVQLLNNERIYDDSWTDFPLRVANYPPFFTFIHAIGIWLTSPTPLIGRLIALLCTCGIMILIAKIVQNHNQSKETTMIVPILAGFLYASSHMAWLWSSIVRVDNLAILLSLTAIYLYTSSSPESETQSRSKNISLLFCALALFTKQTMWAAPLSILLHTLVFEREYLKHRLLYFGGTFGFLYISLMVLTGGHAYRHLVVANINIFDWTIFWAFWRDFWNLYHWTCPLIAMGIFVIFQQKHNKTNFVLLLYVIFASLFSVSIAKVGSSLNYVLELWAVVCMLIGLALQYPTYVQGAKKATSSIFMILLLLYGWQNIFHIPWERQRVGNQKMRAMALGTWNDIATYSTYLPFHYLNPRSGSPVDIIKRNVKLYTPTPAQWELDIMFDIDDYIQQKAKKPILSEDMNFYAIGNGQDIMFQSFEMHQMAIQGIFDEEVLHNCLKKRSNCLPTLVLMFDIDSDINYVSEQRFGRKTVDIMREFYSQSAHLGPYYIYTAK